MFRDKTIFVTGGTGSFGHDFIKLVLEIKGTIERGVHGNQAAMAQVLDLG